MSKQLFLGVDIGTSVVKASVIDTSGRILVERLKSHMGIRPRPGWHEHDPVMHWWRGVYDLIKLITSDLREESHHIAGIAISGIFPTFCPANAIGEPLYNAILYDDSRSTDIVNIMRDELGSTIYGNELLPRIIWFRSHHPDLWAQTRMIFSSHGYIVYKLTGNYCLDSLNACVSGGVFDARSFEWDRQKFIKYDIDPEILPRVNPPSTIAGYLDVAIAKELGLMSGIPIVTGSGDTPLSILGSGAHKQGDILLNYGTVGVMVGLTRNIEHMLDKGIFEEGDSGFKNILILNQLGKQIESLASLVSGESLINKRTTDLQFLDAKASEVQVHESNLIFKRHVTTQASELVMTTTPSASIWGLQIDSSPGEVYRAALESLGFEVRKALEQLDVAPIAICANGGGARSQIWRQIVTDIVGLPQYFIRESTGAYGNALLAAHAVEGIEIGDIVTLQLGRADKTVPIEKNTAIYDKLYERYFSIT